MKHENKSPKDALIRIFGTDRSQINDQPITSNDYQYHSWRLDS